jgi:hypothetical protein
MVYIFPENNVISKDWWKLGPSWKYFLAIITGKPGRLNSLYPRSLKGEGGILFYLGSSVRPRYFSSHFSKQLLMAEIWYLVTTSYRYAILWEAFLDPSDSYFLFADFIDFYTHWTYMHIFLSNYWYLMFGHKLHIGMPYCGKRFWNRQIPTSCLPT